MRGVQEGISRMKIKQYSLAGYDSGTDETDALIKWVAVSDEDEDEADRVVLKLFGEFTSSEEIMKNEEWENIAGIDVVITATTVYVAADVNILRTPNFGKSRN